MPLTVTVNTIAECPWIDRNIYWEGVESEGGTVLGSNCTVKYLCMSFSIYADVQSPVVW